MRRWGKRTLMRALVLFLLLDVLAAAALLVFIGRDRRSAHAERDELARKIGVTADMGAEEQEERFAIAIGDVSRLVTMRSEPEVREGSIALYLSNSEENSCSLSLEISLFGTDECLARCDLVEPGWRLETLPLERVLPPGEYPCLARCRFYTAEGNIFLGQTTRQILLRVS